jgi:hypothetical protein
MKAQLMHEEILEKRFWKVPFNEKEMEASNEMTLIETNVRVEHEWNWFSALALEILNLRQYEAKILKWSLF